MYEPSLGGSVVYNLRLMRHDEWMHVTMDGTRIAIRGPLGCHIWLGATTKRGYPVAKIEGKTRLMRRVVYEREKRVLLPGEKIKMECGERQCLKADHMHAKPGSVH